jgi:small subunit ribosomal protein S18
MARKKSPPRVDRKAKDTGKKFKKKICIFCKERVDWVDYKDVNLLRRFMSDRAKIRARRVTGNDSQQQREVARAIKNAREMALLPYTTRVTTQRKVKSSDNADRAAEPAEVEVDVPVLDDVDTGDGADLAEVDA